MMDVLEEHLDEAAFLGPSGSARWCLPSSALADLAVLDNQEFGTRIQIEGHCDDRGSEEYNIALGAKRAQAAKDYLETLGVTADRMSTISYGKELPVCTEDTDECWAQNRRDHFVVQQ